MKGTMRTIRKLLLLIAVLVPGLAMAQGVPFRTPIVPNAQFTVCVYPESGNPCSNTQNIYADAGLTILLTQPVQLGPSGTFTFFATAGTYVFQMQKCTTPCPADNIIYLGGGSGGGSPAFSAITSGTNAIAAMLCGTGCSLGTSGSGTIAATTATNASLVPFSGVTPGTNTGALVVGTGGSVTETGTGTVNATSIDGVAVTGVPSLGQSIVATGPSTAIWNTGALTTIQNPLTASGLSNSTAPFEVNVDQANCGPTPWIDIRCYGARQVFTGSDPLVNGGITGSIATSSNTLTVTSTTIHTGDNLFIEGAGGANSMSTPAAPGVAVSVATGPTGSGNTISNHPGSTTYAYKVRAFDNLGGYTAASPATTVTFGWASLGSQSLAITNETFSNNIMTVTTAARSPEIFVPTEMVTINSAAYSGQMNILSVPNNTTFTVTIGPDTRNGQGVGPFTGGTIYYFNENVIVPPTPSGTVWGYAVYGPNCPGTCNLLSVSKPTSGVGALDPAYYYVEDYGSTMSGSPQVPVWLPPTDVAPASNDALLAQVTAGGGTTTLTLSASSGSGANFCGTGTCSAATVLLDNSAALIAAVTASVFPGAGGMVYIPATTLNSAFPFQSYASLPGVGSVAVAQAGSIYLNGTINIGNCLWFGVGGITQDLFSFTRGQIVQIGHAYPGMMVDNGQLDLSGVQFISSANNYIDLLINETSSLPVGLVQNVGFGNGPSTDYMGIPVVIWGGPSVGPSGLLFRDFSIATGPTQVTGSSATPLMMNNYFGQFTIENFFLNRRGIFEKVGAPSGNAIIANGKFERQGGITPMFTFMPVVNGGGFVAKIANQIQDTETVSLVSNLTGVSNIALSANLYLDSFGGVTGYPFNYISVNGFNGTFFGGQNVNVERVDQGSANDGVFGLNGHISKRVNNQLFACGGAYSCFADILPPTAPTATAATAGGTLTNNTFTFNIAPVFNEASVSGEGTLSFTSNAITTSGTCPASGNCTIQFTFPPVNGAASYNAYLNGASPLLSQCIIGNFTTTTITVSSPATCNTPPSFSGGGASGYNVNGLWGNRLTLPAVAAPTGTASVTTLYMDSTALHLATKINGNTVSYPIVSTLNENAAVTGQVPLAQNGGATVFTPVGIPYGNGGALLTSCPYTLLADSVTAQRDRATSLDVNSGGACTITLPDPSTTVSTGMSGNFTFRIRNRGTGTVTVNRTSTATFNVINGSAAVAGATSFSLSTGGFATVYSGDNSTWDVDEVSGAANNINLFQSFPTPAAGSPVTICSATGNTYGYGIWIPNPGVFGHIKLLIAVIGGAETYTFGIYNTSGTRVAVTTAQTLPSTGEVSIAFNSSFVAAAGEYYVATGTSGTCTAKDYSPNSLYEFSKVQSNLASGSVVPASIAAPTDAYTADNAEWWIALVP